MAAAEKSALSTSVDNQSTDLKYQAADWNGWQTAYAFDVIRGVKNATADTATSRAPFLASRAQLDKKLADMSATPGLPGAEALAAVKAFHEVDAQVFAAYNLGTPAGAAQANDLVLTTEITNHTTIATALESLGAAASDRAAADAAASDAARSKVAVLVVLVVLGVLVVSLLGVLLVGVVVALVIRSITTPLTQLRARLCEIADGEGDLTVRVDEQGNDEVTSISVLVN